MVGHTLTLQLVTRGGLGRRVGIEIETDTFEFCHRVEKALLQVGRQGGPFGFVGHQGVGGRREREARGGNVLGHLLQGDGVGKSRRVQGAVHNAGLQRRVQFILRHDLRRNTQSFEGFHLLTATNAQLLLLQLFQRLDRLAAKQRGVHDREAEEARDFHVPFGDPFLEHRLQSRQGFEVLIGIRHQAININIGQGGRVTTQERGPDEAQLGRAGLHEAHGIGILEAKGTTLRDRDLELAASAFFHIGRKGADLHRLRARGRVAVVEPPLSLGLGRDLQQQGHTYRTGSVRQDIQGFHGFSKKF